MTMGLPLGDQGEVYKKSTPKSQALPPFPPITPVDPTMQPSGTTGPGVTPGGRPSLDALGAPSAPSTTTPPTTLPGARRATGYVDPTLIERLRAKARKGYAGTFLTGPQGVKPGP
jgi:hypothetical protein